MRKLVAAIASFLAVTQAAPAFAQGITAENVAGAYVEAVGICARAVVAGGVAALPEADRARVAESAPQQRVFAQAPEGRPVWDVLTARGIATISEPEDGQCNVLAYGPRVRPVFDRTAQQLTAQDAGFMEVEAPSDPSSILRVFHRAVGDRVVRIRLDGGEPGMPGRTFRFPMLLAFVSIGEP